LCGKGVTSSIEVIRNPADCSAEIADSLPEPGPLTLISTSRTPLRIAALAARCAACCAANGVLFREPLNPTHPVELVHIVSPSSSVIVINVLLKVALICTTARTTVFLIFLFELLAIIYPVLPSSYHAANRFSKPLPDARQIQSICLPVLLDTLLAGNCLSRAFSRARVALRALASYGQTPSVPNAPIACNITQTRDILGDLPSKLPANNIVAVDNLRNPAEIVFSQLTGLDIFLDSGLFQYLSGGMLTYAYDISQRNPYRLIVGNVNTNYTRHFCSYSNRSIMLTNPKSTLTLLMPRVCADHPHNALAPDYLAIFTYTFYRTSDFHFRHLLSHLRFSALSSVAKNRAVRLTAEGLFDLYGDHKATFQQRWYRRGECE
jgi:hypothetical protein